MSEERLYWEGKKYSFFCHKECEYFPCHPIKDTCNFSCLFAGYENRKKIRNDFK